jgi:multiple sugar transport system permease protein
MNRGRFAGDASVRIAILVCGLAFIAPYALMLCSSFRSSSAIRTSPLDLFGGGWSLANYRSVLDSGDTLTLYANSLLVTTAIVVLQLLLGIPAAFALGHLRPPGAKVVKALIVATLSVPIQATAVTNYLTIAHLGLVDTRRALVLPFLASAFGVYLLCEYAESVPSSQIDAARMLDLGILGRLRNMVLPHMRPAILAFAAFSFVGWWNEFFWPFIVLSDPGKKTVPFAIQAYISVPGGFPDWGALMAAGTLALLPMLLLLLMVQRSFARTVSVTAG